MGTGALPRRLRDRRIDCAAAGFAGRAGISLGIVERHAWILGCRRSLAASGVIREHWPMRCAPRRIA
jgi:hypothetical protein